MDDPSHSSAAGAGTEGAEVVRGWIAELTVMVAACADDAARIDLIAALESMKGASAGGQAELTYAFDMSQIGDARGKAKQKLRRSVCGQIALARRESPHRGGRHVGLAAALHNELPQIRAALNAGRITEWQATVVCRETACLTPEQRRLADGRLAPLVGRVGDHALAAAAARATAEIDPGAVVERAAKSAKDRRVSVRPAPDSMCYFTAHLPVGVGVAAYAALDAQATAVIATPGGDPGIEPNAAPRGRGAIMADLTVQRLTGGTILGCDQFGAPIYAARPATRATAATDGATETGADQSGPAAGTQAADAAVGRPDEPVGIHAHLHIVMSDATLFGAGNEPAEILGYGPVPAEVARRMVAAGLGTSTTTWFRRFYTAPDTGQLAAMESRSRYFPDSLKEFLLVRDRQCRVPFCDAPGRHADHVLDHALGGPTSTANGQMTSADCNFIKQCPGWTHTAEADGIITVTTPTGHRYRSAPPDPPGRRRSGPKPRIDASFLERRLAEILLDYPAA